MELPGLKERSNNFQSSILEGLPEENISAVCEFPPGERIFSHNSDIKLHTASLMKLILAASLFRSLDEGRINPNNKIVPYNEFESIIDNEKYRTKRTLHADIYSISDLIKLMLTESDNQAANILFDLTKPDEIKKTIEDFKMKDTKVIRKLMDLKAHELGLNNTTTASDVATFFSNLFNGNMISAKSRETLIYILKLQKINNRIPNSIPFNIEIAHKTGTISSHIYDAGIIFSKTPFILVVMAHSNKKKITEREGVDIIRIITKRIYAIIEPFLMNK